MTPERWEQIKQIFEAALEHTAAQRAAYIEEACRADSELRAEVENLLSGNARASNFLEKPAAAGFSSATTAGIAATFADGEIISERFRVLRFIGKGGMGEVYAAEDLELGERVALKTIRPEISSDHRIIARFKHEIQLARRVTHPNVCRMFDFERHDSSDGTANGSTNPISFLTMELLEGETLSERLKRQGRFSAAEALPLIEQMAEALDAAHEAGVIHRDFKPSNVILVPSPKGTRAVVTDFGLARVNAAEGAPAITVLTSSLTASGHILGTPAYMSPEQLEGGVVTPATDIYNLGLVMYEMLAGTRPFTDDAPFAGAFKRVKEPPPSPRTLVPDLDPRWDSTIMRCLEIEPARRFVSAREVGAALRGLDVAPSRRISGITPPPSTTPLSTGFPGTASSKDEVKVAGWGFFTNKRIFAAAALFVVLVALFVWRSRLGMWAGKPQIEPGATVLLTDISNVTGDPELDGVTEVLRSALTQSAHFNLMERSRVCEVLQRMARPCTSKLDPAVAREVAMRDSVPRVVFGTISRVAEDYRLDLKIEQPDTEPTSARHNWPFSESASGKKELFDVIRDGSNWIRQTVGEASKDLGENDQPLQDITTPSWQALATYVRAEDLKSQNKPEEAIVLLENAIQLDKEFALAYARMGDMEINLQQYSDGYKNWEKALSIAGGRRLTSREELRIRGLSASDMHDFAGAEKVFRTYTIDFPNDVLGWFYLSDPLMMLDRSEEAIEALKKADAAKPGTRYVPYHLALDYLSLERFADAEPYLQKVREAGFPDAADYLKGMASFLQGHYSDAEHFFADLEHSNEFEWQNDSYSIQACLYAELGRYQKAIDALDRGIDADGPAGRREARANRLLSRAYLDLKMGARQACREDCLEALRYDAGLPRSLGAGTLLARAGFPEDADMVARNLGPEEYHPISDIVRIRLRGEILLARGGKAEALAAFQKASGLSAPGEEREYLAHALAASGKPSEAWEIYHKMASQPGRFWQHAVGFFPGFWADALFDSARLGKQLGKSEAKDNLQKYLNLRAAEDPKLRDLEKLSRLNQ